MGKRPAKPPQAPTFADAASDARGIPRRIQASGKCPDFPERTPVRNSHGNSPAAQPRSRGISRRMHIRNTVESPGPSPVGWISAPHRGRARFRRPSPLNIPANGPKIPAPSPFQNIRRPAGRRGLQAGSRIRISQVVSFLAAMAAVRKRGQIYGIISRRYGPEIGSFAEAGD